MELNKILILIIVTLISLNSLYALTENDPEYKLIETELQLKNEIKIIVELYPEKNISINSIFPDFFNIFLPNQPTKKIIENDGYFYDKTEIGLLQNRTKDKLNQTNINIDSISQSKMSPFFSINVNKTSLKKLLDIEEIKRIRIDEINEISVDFSIPQIGGAIAHAQGYTGEGQVIAILDTGFEKAHEMLAGKIISEACYSQDLCPGGIRQTTAFDSAEPCVGNNDCKHGTHVAGIAVGDNGAGLKGAAPDAKLIAIKVASWGSPRLGIYTSDLILGLERVYELSSTYNIAAVSMSLGGGKYTTNCDGEPEKTAIDALRSKGIAVFASSGNDGYTDGIGGPACISTVISVGATTDTDLVSGFSNSDDILTMFAPGNTILSAVPGGNTYESWPGTSMATPMAAGAWLAIKSANPKASYNEIYDAMMNTGTPITDAKSPTVTKPRLNIDKAIEQIATPTFLGGEEIIDIELKEKISQQILYNPLKYTSGLYQNQSEIQQQYYSEGGEIIIKNTHATEEIENVRIEISQLGNVYNFSHLSGQNGFVNEYDEFFTYLEIPDLGPGKNSTFKYNINISNIKPPLDLTTKFTKEKIIPGYDLEIYDTITNQLDYLEDTNDTCIYDININQIGLSAIIGPNTYNFTFVNNSIQGTDATNVTLINNKTMDWDVQNSQCLYLTNTTDIDYKLNIPPGINESKNYLLTNSSISFKFNQTASEIKISRVLGSVNLDLGFTKKTTTNVTNDNATWQVKSKVTNPTALGINLKKVSLWVSEKNGTGTGFTNPSIIDKDKSTNEDLLQKYYPNYLLNQTNTIYTNNGSEWTFDYTYSNSPIVWMNIENNLIDNDVQVIKSPISTGNNFIYLKEIYITSNYLIEISKNITRIEEDKYNVKITVINKGQARTSPNQFVVIYNFIPNQFSLDTAFQYSTSDWYTTDMTSSPLSDPIYNGTMYQYALLPNLNLFNSSLDRYNSESNQNNTWTVEYNISGIGEFNYDDLFLTGVDPLQVEKIGGTQSISIESTLKSIKSNFEPIAIILTTIITIIVIAF